MKKPRNHFYLLAVAATLACVPLYNSCKPQSAASAAAKPGHNAQVPEKLEQSGSFSGANALYHTAKLCEMGPRQPQSPQLAASRQYIISQLQACGWEAREQRFSAQTPRGNMEFVNIIARYKGARQPARMLLSCHIDSKILENFVAANDGAAHTGLLLELARLLAADEQLATQLELVFFDGEEAIEEMIIVGEDGLYGSAHYASELLRSGQPLPKFAVNVDMPGWKNLCMVVPNDIDAFGYALWQQATRDIKPAEGTFKVFEGSMIDDHVSLIAVGIPTLNMIADFTKGGWWHTPQDNLANISARSLQTSGEVVLRILKLAAQTLSLQQNPSEGR